MNKFKIGWMFPDTLFLHGDRGNVAALERFAGIAGLEAVTNREDFESKAFDPMRYQVLFFGPGEISSFSAVKEWLEPYKERMIEYIESRHPMLVTSTSTGLFCKSILRSNGDRIEGLGLIDAEFIENNKVYGDDIFFKTVYHGTELEIIGNQIQMGDLTIGSGKPFGSLLYGYGNTGKGRDEGVLEGASIFTNTLGPLLISNPWLTIEIVRQAAEVSGIEIDEAALTSFDDSLERASFKTKRDFIMKKETNLSNCNRSV